METLYWIILALIVIGSAIFLAITRYRVSLADDVFITVRIIGCLNTLRRYDDITEALKAFLQKNGYKKYTLFVQSKIGTIRLELKGKYYDFKKIQGLWQCIAATEHT